MLVTNLPGAAADQWADLCPPDARIRLDVEYHRVVGAGADPVMGDVTPKVRTDWRRRWRRATEMGVHLVEEFEPDPADVDEVLALANGSAVRHDWPPVYDAATAQAVLRMPGARLIRAVWEDKTVAGFVALEYDRRLYLWAGGTDAGCCGRSAPTSSCCTSCCPRHRSGAGTCLSSAGATTRSSGSTASTAPSCGRSDACRPADVAAYADQLATLHERLGRVMGLDG